MSTFDFLSPNDVLGKRVTHKLRQPRPPAPPRNSITPTPSSRGNTVYNDPNTGRVRTRVFSPPVQGDYRISSPFGTRTHPVTGRTSNHTGMDFAVGMGTPVYAPRGGVIEQRNEGDSIYGNQLVMRHGPHMETMYGHMSGFGDVEPGQHVKRGDLIGYVGSTGLSTGPHLHWETWKNGNPVNPNDLFDPSLPRRLPRQPGTEKRSNRELPDLSEANQVDVELAQALGLKAPASNAAPNMSPIDMLRTMQQGQGRPQGSHQRNPQLQAFLRAISTQESGGNYNAVGVDTGGGNRAYGKYQIMNYNIDGPGGWDQEALGRNISIQDFLNSPDLQEQIARAKLRQYFKEYGPEGAAKAWYAGPGNAFSNSTSPQYGGPSIQEYAASVLRHMNS